MKLQNFPCLSHFNSNSIDEMLKKTVLFLVFSISHKSAVFSTVFEPIPVDIYPLKTPPLQNCSQVKYFYLRDQLEECEKNVTERLIDANPGLFTQTKLKVRLYSSFFNLKEPITLIFKYYSDTRIYLQQDYSNI